MKKIISFIVVLFAMTLLFGCFGDLNEVESISIDYQLKEQYVLSTSIDLSAVKVNVTKTNGETYEVLLSNANVTKASGVTVDFKLDTSSLGTKSFKITYMGVSFTVQYSIISANEWDGITYTAPDLSGNIYTIDAAAKMAWVAQQSALDNDFSGKTLQITANMNLGTSWTAIKYLENCTIEGVEISEGVYPTVTLIGGRSFISYTSALTMRNLNFSYDINQSSFSGIVDTIWADEDFTDERITSFTNVEASGNIFVTAYGAGFVGWVEDNWAAPVVRNEKVMVINCKNSVNLTTLGTNSGLFVGYSGTYKDPTTTNQNTTIHFDNATLNGVTGKLTALKANVGSCIGLYWGHSGVDLYVEGVKYTGNQDELPNVTHKNKSESGKFIQITSTNFKYEAKPTDTFNAPSMIGIYAEVNKLAGATELIVYLQYSYGLGYPMRVTNRIDISSKALNEKITTPQKFMYVSQNPESANWLNYIYDTQYDETAASQNYYAISTKVSIYAIQVNSNNEPINAVIYNYINVPNK